MSYVNEKYKQAQIGSMRTNIHLNRRVNQLAPDESLNAVLFYIKNSRVKGLQFMQTKVESDSIVNTETGEKIVQFAHTRTMNG
jgi:hypothetical protein